MSLFVPAREPETWLGETWSLSSIMWSAGSRVGVGAVIWTKWWGGGEAATRPEKLFPGRTIVVSCSQDMFPWLCHNMIPWISTWLELGENYSHNIICNKLWHKFCLVYDKIAEIKSPVFVKSTTNSSAKLIWIIKGTCHIWSVEQSNVLDPLHKNLH